MPARRVTRCKRCGQEKRPNRYCQFCMKVDRAADAAKRAAGRPVPKGKSTA